MTPRVLAAIMLLALVGSPAEASNEGSSLIAALHDEDPDIRALAAMLLADEAEAEGPAVTRALSERTRDRAESWRVRVAAAESLARRGADGSDWADGFLRIALDESDDWRVRAAAIEALDRLAGGGLLARALAEAPPGSEVSNGSSTVALHAAPANAQVLGALIDPDPRMRALARTVLETAAGGCARGAVALDSELPCLTKVLLRLAVVPGGQATGTLCIY